MVNNSQNHVIPCWETEERYGTIGNCSCVLEKAYFRTGWAKDEDLTSCSYLSGVIEHE